MRRRIRWMVVACWALASPALAAGLRVSVVDGHGLGVADAVVTVVPDDPTSRASPASAPRTLYIDQKNETFIPYVQVFRPGDSVVFRNSDSTRHHVYSFSKVKTFQFVLRRGESSPPMVLEHTGIAAVGCNIHDQMIAYLFVTDAPTVAVSDAGGRLAFDGLAAGRYTVRVWHPQLFPYSPPVVRHVEVHDGAPTPVAFTLKLMPDPRKRMDREHMDY